MISENANKYYVYCFYNEDWQDVFYIGKGCGNRYKDISDRNPHIKSIFKKHNCITKIIVDNLTEENALAIEKNYKELYKLNGSPIIDYEKTQITDLQRSGIERAKVDGKYKGRQPIKVDESKLKSVYTRWKAGEITARQAQRELDLKADTFYRRVKVYEKDKNTFT